jgi:hypothetical protein
MNESGETGEHNAQQSSDPQSFKNRNRELQELVREWHVVREHNLQFKEGDSQHNLLMFAEGALLLVALERFLRCVLGVNASDQDTLPNLLEKAMSKRLALIKPPGGDKQGLIKAVTNFRNALLHGNFEQAAKWSGHASAIEYFRKSYASELETAYRIANAIIRQIDPNTGLPKQVTSNG